MPEDNPNIDNLVRVIEDLQDRIKSHTKIRFNETRTRDDLINPLLRALGWEGPSVITSEYSMTRGFRPKKADYALHEPGQTKHPVAFIEAKRMNEDLAEDHLQQVLGYARSRKSVKYIGLTNGDRWIFYDVSDVNRPVVDVSISNQSAYLCADQLQQFKRGGERFGVPMYYQKLADESDIYKRATTDITRPASSPRYHSNVSSVLSKRQIYIEPIPDVDVYKVLGRSGLSVLLFGILGYFIGFRAAQPVLEEFVGLLGAAAIGFAVIGVAVLALRYLHLPWQRLSLSWLWQVEGDVKKTLIWSCSGIVVGGAIGGILGYVAGLHTAQPIFDMFAVVGQITLIAILASVVILVLFAGSRNARRRSRRYYRGRRYY